MNRVGSLPFIYVPNLQVILWKERTFSMKNELHMLGMRLVVFLLQISQVFEDIHTRHLSITKCKTKAKHSLWCPSIKKVIEIQTANYEVCNWKLDTKYVHLRSSVTPNCPWQMLGNDLFQLERKNYLIVTKYYSTYLNIALLGRNTTSQNVISCVISIFISCHAMPYPGHILSIFFRYGIKDFLISNNKLQYVFEDFLEIDGRIWIYSCHKEPKFCLKQRCSWESSFNSQSFAQL